jgi:hypothetical protein
MNKITFTGSNVMSNEMANQTGNISRKLFSTDNALVRKGDRRPPVGMGAELAQTNPFAWNSEVPGETTDEMLPAYLHQVRLSAYYQNNPLPVLEFSTEYGGVQEPLGGPLRKKL